MHDPTFRKICCEYIKIKVSYTHCYYRDSLDKVQLMKMKPVWRETDEL